MRFSPLGWTRTLLCIFVLLFLQAPYVLAQRDSCKVKILSPTDGERVCDDAITIEASASFYGDLSSVTAECSINGIPTTPDDSGVMTVDGVPLNVGANTIMAQCSFTDQQGQLVAFCVDTITVVYDTLQCGGIELIQDDIFCDPNGAGYAALMVIQIFPGGVMPEVVEVTIGGVMATYIGGAWEAIFPIAPGPNNITIKWTVKDACGNIIECETDRTIQGPEPLACRFPADSLKVGSIVCADGGTTLTVSGFVDITGGFGGHTAECWVNGVPAAESGDGHFSATIPVPGSGDIVINCTVTDECGVKTECDTTVTIDVPAPLECSVQLGFEPGDLFCSGGKANVFVGGFVFASGGLPGYDIKCEVNGVPATPGIASSFSATITLPADGVVKATCTVTDTCGVTTTCTDSIIFDLPQPACSVNITRADSTFCTTDGFWLVVEGDVTPSGGTPPYSVKCEVNGNPATPIPPDGFRAIVPFPADGNIVAICEVSDECGRISICADSVTVDQPPVLQCEINITAPDDSVVCVDSVEVAGQVIVSGAFGPTTIMVLINGEATPVSGSNFMSTLTLEPGDNTIVIEATITDTCGRETVCQETINVHYDAIRPKCKFRVLDGNRVKGHFLDEGSGMKQIIVEIENGIVELEPPFPFPPGTERVDFTVEPSDPGKSMPFTLIGYDCCGRKTACDPVFLGLNTNGTQRTFDFKFQEIDRYFHLTNFGLSEVRIDLNGNKFKLTPSSDAAINTFAMPAQGTIVIDMARYLQLGENSMFVAFDGPSGTRADLLLVDVPMQSVDFELNLEVVPEAFELAQNYPNPFNPETTIRYDIPAHLADGVHVRIDVYNLMGERVRTLVDTQKAPGSYSTIWDAQDDRGIRVSSGIYIYRITAGEFRQTKRMLLLK